MPTVLQGLAGSEPLFGTESGKWLEAKVEASARRSDTSGGGEDAQGSVGGVAGRDQYGSEADAA